ncbi:IS3 family transposase [Ancylomarina sp. 16SWW S1-10-2]|uniref:IS3 family transposase n=1 Tax=Ancylomarina sp. 16SWW S1-10-2 TaxID=2499681 RepID=UPI0034CD8B0E
MITRVINQFKAEQNETIVSTCRLLGVDRQVYYRANRSKLKSQTQAQKVLDLVVPLRELMPRIGTKKLYHILNEPLKELKLGRDKLHMILKANNLLIKPKKSYHVTTNSHHRFKKHKNLIENLVPTRPEQVWVTDITYIGNRPNHSYLALVTDAYSKKIVGYDLSDSLHASGAIGALKMAVKQRMYQTEPLIHHSDRGVQYCCTDYQKLLKRKNLNCSMTESYDPYANAVAERVNGILKSEFELERFTVNIDVMKKIIKQSIDIYNTFRPHYSCYMNTPEYMHKQRKVKIRTYKNNQYHQD